MQSVKLLKKATISHIVGSATVKTFKDYKGETPIVRIIGAARQATMVATPHGEAPKFVGNFATVNLLTGERGRATTLFLPAPVDQMLYDTVMEASDDAKRAGIEFAFDVTVEPNEKSVTGYVYNVKNLIESKVADPLEHLLQQVGTPQLSAPQTAAPAEAAPQANADADPEAEKPAKGKTGK